MPKTTSKTEIRVTVDIKPVKLAELTPARRQLVRRFWSRLIGQVQDEMKAAQKEAPPSQAPADDALTGGAEESSSDESR